MAATGASYYREALEGIAGNPDGEAARAFCTAHLVPEDENPADPHAIGVYVCERKVGHLDRRLAQNLRKHLAANGILVQATTCDAVLTNGLRTSEREYSYTVELDLSIPQSLPEWRKPTYPAVVRESAEPVFYWRETGWCLVETRMPFHARADHDSSLVRHWTTDEWNVINYYLPNSRRIGLGHKLFSISKAHVRERFGELPEARIKLIHGSTVLVELKATTQMTSNPSGAAPK